MQQIQIIPAIDIIDGKCVRLSQGDYNQKNIYRENPLEMAKSFEAAGFQKLHLVDLDGAKARQVVNLKVLEKIAGQTRLQIEFGGGIKTDADLRKVFECGAAQAIIGTVAVKQPALFFSWLDCYGSEKIILGADVKGERLAINGWLETSNVSIYDFLESHRSGGLKYVICTDVSKDGMLGGTALGLYERLIRKFPDLHIIASGGVSSPQDIENLARIHCPSVVVGKAIYEGRLNLETLLR